MDEKDRFSRDQKVTPLFRHSHSDAEFGEVNHDDLIAEQEKDAEYASEPAAVNDLDDVEDKRRDEEHSVGLGIGWLSFILSVIGLFFLPVVMGTAGVIIGFIAMRQGAKTLGGWAIAIGVISLVLRLFVGPFI